MTPAVAGLAGFGGDIVLARFLQANQNGQSNHRRSRFELNYAALTAVVTSFLCDRTCSAPNLGTIRF